MEVCLRYNNSHGFSDMPECTELSKTEKATAFILRNSVWKYIFHLTDLSGSFSVN